MALFQNLSISRNHRHTIQLTYMTRSYGVF